MVKHYQLILLADRISKAVRLVFRCLIDLMVYFYLPLNMDLLKVNQSIY